MKFHINGGVCSFVTFNGGFSDAGLALETFGAFNKKTLVHIFFTENDNDVPLEIFNFIDNSPMMRTNLNKSQLDLILSFDTADEVMSYALSLYAPSMESYSYFQQKISNLSKI